MKKTLFIVLLSFGALLTFAQKAKPITPDKPLPKNLYQILRDSCTQLDIVYAVGGSMSIDGRNVRLFSSFVEPTPAHRQPLTKDGFIMWQINGREFITGDMYFSSDTTGYLLFKKNNVEYINALNKQGASFLKKQKK